MNYSEFDFLAFCDESTRQGTADTSYFVHSAIVTTPRQYEGIKQRLASNLAADILGKKAEYKGNILRAKNTKKILEIAFPRKSNACVGCRVDFCQNGLEPYLYFSYAFSLEFSVYYPSADSASFRRDLALKLMSAIPLDRMKLIHRQIHSHQPNSVFSGFKKLAENLRDFAPKTSLGSIARSIDLNFSEQQTDFLLTFGTNDNQFISYWPHQSLHHLTTAFEQDPVLEGKKILILHDKFEKLEKLYKDNPIFDDIKVRTNLRFVDSVDEIGVQMADLLAWFSGHTFFDNSRMSGQVWLSKQFDRKYMTSSFDVRYLNQ